jgi:opacity protein-like surface antigen
MKRFLCGILMIMTVSTGVVAQTVGFGAHADIANLSLGLPASSNVGGSLKDAYGPGYGGGAHFDVGLIGYSFRLSVDYLSFSPDNDKYRQVLAGLLGNSAAGYTIDGGKITIWSGSVNAKMAIFPLPLIQPYLTGGIGLANIKADGATVAYQGTPIGNPPGVPSQTKTLFNLGAGLDLKVGITLFVELRYTWILTDGEKTTYLPVMLGVTL